MIKIFYFAISFILVHQFSYSFEGIDSFESLEFSSDKKFISQHQEYFSGQFQYNKEKDDSGTVSSAWDVLLCCFSINFPWKNNRYQKNICSLPEDVIIYLSNFLSSPDILRLSCSCKELRRIFSDGYWHSYWYKISKTSPYLTVLSPCTYNKKKLLGRLWYSQGYIELAANLNHPEAKMLRDYSRYGVVIGKDQYLCYSGSIKNVFTGKVDYERTEKLRKAEQQKTKEDIEKLEIRMKTRKNLMEKFLKY